MKTFSKLISILSIICITVSGITITASADSPSMGEQTIDVKFRQTIDIPNVTTQEAESLESAIEAGATTGWFYNETEERFERLVTYDDIEVTIAGSMVELNNEGRTRILTQTQDTIEIIIHDPVSEKTYTQLVSGDSKESAIVIDLDISPMISIDKDNEALNKDNINNRASSSNPYWSDGEKGAYGDRLHCNRFNGYLGNGTYYSNNARPQALTNFFASDCDWALGSYTKCLADYGSNPYCAASPASKQGSCSTLMGHYNRFHMHTKYSGN